MARGQLAKENVAKKIINLFGENFIAEQDKKIYVWENDGNEKVQIAISLTCPKNFIETSNSNEDYDFSESSIFPTVPTEPAIITEKETETLQDLLKKFGLD